MTLLSKAFLNLLLEQSVSQLLVAHYKLLVRTLHSDLFKSMTDFLLSLLQKTTSQTHAVRSTRPDTQLPASASTAASASTVSSNTAVATKPDTTGRLRRITYYGEPPAPHLDAQQSVSQLVTERGKRGSKAPLRRRSSRTQTQESLQPVRPCSPWASVLSS